MSGMLCVASSGAQEIGAGSPETIFQLLAANNHRIKITGYSVTVAGTTPIDLTLQVVRQSSSGSPGTSFTPSDQTSGLISKLDSDAAGTIQTSGFTNFSSTEPTTSAILQYKKLNGGYEKYFPFGQEIIVPEEGRIGIVCTSVSAATVAAEFYFEE